MDEARGVPELGVEVFEALDHPVVRQQRAVLLKRVGVAHLHRACRGEAQMRDERARDECERLARDTGSR